MGGVYTIKSYIESRFITRGAYKVYYGYFNIEVKRLLSLIVVEHEECLSLRTRL